VLKSSGEMATWVSKWARTKRTRAALETLARAMAEDPQHSSSYIYKLERLYGDFFRDLDDERLRKMLLAERLVGRGIDAEEDAAKYRQADQHVRAIMDACTVHGSGERRRFSLEGAFIARFLADNGFVDPHTPSTARGEAA